jgi:hypothetical protein
MQTAFGSLVRRFCILHFAFCISLAADPARAQSAGDTTFRIFSRGQEIGSHTVALTRSDDGWHLTSTGEMKEPFQLVLRQFDITYDLAWRPRIMTMEISSVDDRAVVHVAFGLSDGSTRTDVVRAGTAQWGSNKVSPDAIPLPDYVFAAFEALAARLTSSSPGTQLHAFVVPRFEGLLHVDRITSESVPTTGGPLETRRFGLRLARPEGEAPLDVWVANDRLVRVDIPKEGMSVVRQDVVWGK